MFSFSINQVSSEDAASYTELVPMTGGAADEVKVGLRNAIKTRRVAQGLEGIPHIEAKRPKVEVVSRSSDFIQRKLFSLFLHYQCSARVLNETLLFAVLLNNRYANFQVVSRVSSVIQGHVPAITLFFFCFFFFQLSSEEEEKRRIRRERNKIAAFKCRQRRKEHMQKLQDVSIFIVNNIYVSCDVTHQTGHNLPVTRFTCLIHSVYSPFRFSSVSGEAIVNSFFTKLCDSHNTHIKLKRHFRKSLPKFCASANIFSSRRPNLVRPLPWA